jgi:hypothetical protein
VASKFERKLDAARTAYEQNDPFKALRRLDDARRDAVGRRNEEQLHHVLDFADGVIARDERTEIERETVIYAARQNLRQIGRRRAYDGEQEWVDPYPHLEAPHPQTRTYLSAGVKVWIGVGVAIGTAVIVLWLLSPLFD